jgi:anti-sigma factor RsiW
MDCKEFRELLDLYVDDELSPEATALASVHSTECESCHRAKVELVRLQHTVKRVVSQYDPPAELVESVKSISQSRWRKTLFQLKELTGLFGFQAHDHRRVGNGSSTQTETPIWRRQIPVPVPVFILLLMAILFSGVRLAVVRKGDRPSGEALNKTSSNVTRSNASQDETDIARFDHGGRTAIYKVQLAKPRNRE